MTDAVAVALIAGVPATIGSIGTFIVILRQKKTDAKVDRIETQTNSMNSEMTNSARKEGRQEGKERAEAVAATASAAVAAMTTTPALPIVIAPAPAPNQDEIVRWIQQGIALEKARRDAQGNGPR